MADVLPLDASKDQIKEHLENQYSGTDVVVDDAMVDAVHSAQQAHSSWRQSLDPVTQVQMAGTPATFSHVPEADPAAENPDPTAAGVNPLDPRTATPPESL